MSTSAGTRPSAAAMERFGVSGNDKRVSYFSAKDDTDDDDDDDTLVVIGQSDSRTTEEPPSPETSRYSRRGKTRRQGRDGSWCWINEVEQRASAEDTRPRAKTTEAKTFTATIHNCSREEIVRRGVKPPSALNLSSAMPARRDGDGAATIPFSPIPEVKTVGTLKQQLRTKSSVTGSDHRDRARASRSDHGRHRSPSKSVGHNDSWDWITGIQDDLQGKDITRLRAYVARQKALAKTEIPLHAADGSTRRRRKSHSMNDKLWAGPSTPVASDTPEATDSGGNTPGSAGDRQSRAGRSGSGGSTATEGSDAGAAQYTCSDAELAHVRSALEMRFPESARLYSDGYIRSVVAQYDSAHPKRRRTLEYCIRKLQSALQWRAQMRVDDITAQECRRALCVGSLYWYGYDQEFRPILWVRPNKKDWSHLDVDMEVKMHIRMIEDGIRMMPDNGKVSQFVIVADARGKNPPIAFMRALLIMFTKGYPDRLGAILAGPTGFFLRMLFRLLKPLMPKRLARKIKLMSLQGIRETIRSRLGSNVGIPQHFNDGAQEEEEYCRHPWDDVEFRYGEMLQTQALQLDKLCRLMLRDTATDASMHDPVAALDALQSDKQKEEEWIRNRSFTHFY